MIARQYVRAEYDEDRGSYVSDEAEWIAGKPSLEYCFNLQEDESTPHAWVGRLEKLWCDEDGSGYGEFFVFAAYDDESGFDADVEAILLEAQDVSIEDNIDEFLAITDIVKERAVALGYEDDSLLDLEGLFQNGPEDAYTRRDPGDSPRLHHHIECEDEYWYFHTAAVVDTDQQLLGWGLFAVYLPDLASNAPQSDIENAREGRILLLDHLHNERDAKLAKRGMTHFMETERLDNPQYAYMNDTEVLAGVALGAEYDDTGTVIWHDFSGETLQDFLNGTAPYVCPRDKWQPAKESLADRFFKQYPQPTWLEDQLRAALDEQVDIHPEDDEDSPWNTVELG